MKIDLPPHMSYSSLTTYLQCGEKYRLQRIAKAPQIPAWALVGGSAAHETTEYRDRVECGQTPEGSADFNETFDRLIAQEVERSGVPTAEWSASGRSSKAWPDREDEKWWREKGPEMVEFWSAWRINSPWTIWFTDDDQPAIEIEVNALFGGQLVKTFIDRVFVSPDGEPVILDLKFGSRTPEPDQLGTYAGAMEATLGVRPSKGTYWMGRTGGTSAVFNLDEWTNERLAYEYTSARRGMEAGIFMPHKSNLCGSCSVRESCFAYGGANAADFTPIRSAS